MVIKGMFLVDQYIKLIIIKLINIVYLNLINQKTAIFDFLSKFLHKLIALKPK